MRVLKREHVRCQRDECVTALTERDERGEVRRIWMVGERRMKKSVPSSCQIPTGSLASQLSRFRRPAEVITAPCGLDCRPLAHRCNVVKDVQIGPEGRAPSQKSIWTHVYSPTSSPFLWRRHHLCPGWISDSDPVIIHSSDTEQMSPILMLPDSSVWCF